MRRTASTMWLPHRGLGYVFCRWAELRAGMSIKGCAAIEPPRAGVPQRAGTPSISPRGGSPMSSVGPTLASTIHSSAHPLHPLPPLPSRVAGSSRGVAGGLLLHYQAWRALCRLPTQGARPPSPALPCCMRIVFISACNPALPPARSVLGNGI